MAYQELRILCTAAEAEALSDALMDLGALSVSIEDADLGTPAEKPIFGEPGSTADATNWERSWLSALFDGSFQGHALKTLTHQAFSGILPEDRLPERLSVLVMEIRAIAEQDWVRLTQSQFEPIQISPRLWIVPTWHEPPDASALVIRLDPGLAFGTGSHPTTHLCLRWLDAHLPPQATVIDYGCGSGILGIAAAKLGARAVCGLDIDPQAVIATAQNAAANAVAMPVQGADAAMPSPADVVVANILTNPLKVLAPTLCALVKPGGQLVLSGILESQADDVIAAYAPMLPLKLHAALDGWVCLAGRKG